MKTAKLYSKETRGEQLILHYEVFNKTVDSNGDSTLEQVAGDGFDIVLAPHDYLDVDKDGVSVTNRLDQPLLDQMVKERLRELSAIDTGTTHDLSKLDLVVGLSAPEITEE